MELIEISNPDESDPIMAILRGVAMKSDLKFKVGACLIKRGRILAVGNNKRKTHPFYGSKAGYMTLHAEGDLLYNCQKLGIDTKGATIIVYRKNGLNAKPCPACEKLIKKAGIKEVHYTNHEN